MKYENVIFNCDYVQFFFFFFTTGWYLPLNLRFTVIEQICYHNEQMCRQKARSNSPLLVFLCKDELGANRNLPCALVRCEWAEAAAVSDNNNKK